MAEFTPINTQEELDNIIKDRLSRQETKIRGEYAEFDSLKNQAESWASEKEKYEQTIKDSKTKYAELHKQYDEATGKIAQYEIDALKTKVAMESGLPVGLYTYLKGNTEEDIRKSAEELGKYAKAGQRQPMAEPEADPPKNNEDAIYLKMAKQIKER